MSGVSIRQQFANTMLEIGSRDPKLVVIVCDISHFLLQPFAEACKGRYFNIGICEPATVSVAAGLAKIGLIPVVHTIAPFLIERSYEQLKLDFCYQCLGGNIVTVGSAYDYSNLGCTHHCYSDFALLKPLENCQIFYPATCQEFHILFSKTYNTGKLNVFRIPKTAHTADINSELIVPGKGIKLTDSPALTIVATGPQLNTALAARDELTSLGLSPEILYIHTIKPFDSSLVIESVRKTRRVIVIEEHSEYGGVGDEVLRYIHGLGQISYANLSIPDRFVRDYGSYEDLCSSLSLSKEGIIFQAKSFLSKDRV